MPGCPECQQLLVVALTHALLPALLLRMRMRCVAPAADRRAAGSILPAQAAVDPGPCCHKASPGHRQTKQCTARQLDDPPSAVAAHSSRDAPPCKPCWKASSYAAAPAAATKDVCAVSAWLPAAESAQQRVTLPANSITSSPAARPAAPPRVMDLHKLLAGAAAARHNSGPGSNSSYRPITTSKVVSIKAHHAGMPYSQLSQALTDGASQAVRQHMMAQQAAAGPQQGRSPLLNCSAVVVPGCAQLLMPLTRASAASGDSDSLLDAIAAQLLASFPADGAESAAGPGLEMLHVQLGSELRLPDYAGADSDASCSSPGGYVVVPSAGQWGCWGLEPVCLPFMAADKQQEADQARRGDDSSGQASVLLSFDPSSCADSAGAGDIASVGHDLAWLLHATGCVRVVAQQGGAVLLDRQLPLELPVTGVGAGPLGGGGGQLEQGEERLVGCFTIRVPLPTSALASPARLWLHVMWPKASDRAEHGAAANMTAGGLLVPEGLLLASLPLLVAPQACCDELQGLAAALVEQEQCSSSPAAEEEAASATAQAGSKATSQQACSAPQAFQRHWAPFAQDWGVLLELLAGQQEGGADGAAEIAAAADSGAGTDTGPGQQAAAAASSVIIPGGDDDGTSPCCQQLAEAVSALLVERRMWACCRLLEPAFDEQQHVAELAGGPGAATAGTRGQQAAHLVLADSTLGTAAGSGGTELPAERSKTDSMHACCMQGSAAASTCSQGNLTLDQQATSPATAPASSRSSSATRGLLQSLALCWRGFQPAASECEYARFRSASAAPLDLPGMLLMLATSASAMLRSKQEQQQALAKTLWRLLVHVLCNAPYAVMLLRPRLWAEHRELTFVLTQALAVPVSGLLFLNVLPRPDSMVQLACGGAGLAFSVAYGGLLLPWLMQMRTRPGLMVQAWGAAMGNLPMRLMCVPVAVALRDAALVFCCAAVVSVVGDLRCRRRWLRLRGAGAMLGGSAAAADSGVSGKLKGE